MINLKKNDSITEAVKKIVADEESGLRMAAHAAHRDGKSHFHFQGKTYPVKVQGENIGYGECISEPEAKKIAKGEIGKHEKKMHNEEININKRSEDTLGGRLVTNQKDDVGPSSDGKSTKVKFHGGPDGDKIEGAHSNQPQTTEVELSDKRLASKDIQMVRTTKPVQREVDDVRAKAGRAKQGMKESFTLKSFKEKYEDYSIFDQMIAEVLSKDADAGDWIHDFVHSDNPKFAGKSKTKRKEMALAAYYAKQRNEEVELEEGLGDKLKAAGKKALEKLGHGDDEAMRKDLQKKAGLPQTGKKPTSEEVEQIDELSKGTLSSYLNKKKSEFMKGKTQPGTKEFTKDVKNMGKAHDKLHKEENVDEAKDTVVRDKEGKVTSWSHEGDWQKTNPKKNPEGKVHNLAGMALKKSKQMAKEETVEEGWEDMLKAVKDRAKPQPSGGSGVKQGHRYGGAKQKDKPEHDEDKMKKESEAHVIKAKSNMLLEPDPDMPFKKKPVPANKPAYKVKAFESKRPESDTVPFVTNESKPLSVAKELAKKSMKRMKTEMMGKISN